MCEFFSGVVDKKGFVYTGSGTSHGGVPEAYKLKAGSYREFEWYEDDKGESLTVRTEGGSDEVNWWKALILGKYPTRKALFKALPIGRSGDDVYYLKNGIPSRPAKEGPAHIDFETGIMRFMKDGGTIRAVKGGPHTIAYDGYRDEDCSWVRAGDLDTKQQKAKFEKIIALGRKFLLSEYEKHFKKPPSKKLLKEWADQ